MSWQKLGRIFNVDGRYEWMHSHAAVPIAERLTGDEYRVYFSSRDRDNRSFTGFFDIDLTAPADVLRLSEAPVLAPGGLAMFDEAGSMATWLLEHDGTRYVYYIGWNLGKTVPFRNAVGLAVSPEPGGAFTRYAAGPIIDRGPHDPCFTASCCVLVDEGLWRMWYLSCDRWTMERTGPRHHYRLRYAESDDGVEWRRDGTVAIDFKDPGEYAISRPSVLRDADLYRMWYSFRGDAYRIGYAESKDGIRWVRRDEVAGLGPSDTGWDSEMVEYPYVFDHGPRRYMLYNGNGYGMSGIGLAVWVS